MLEIMMHESIAKDCLTLGGPLTVRHMGQIHTRVLEALRQYAFVNIDCSDATDVDLSFIQLVLSARKSAAATGKSLSLAHPAVGVLLERLMQAGLVGPADGQPVSDQSFWLSQGDA